MKCSLDSDSYPESFIEDNCSYSTAWKENVKGYNETAQSGRLSMEWHRPQSDFRDIVETVYRVLHNWKELRKYLKGVEEQLTVHADFPARPLKCMRHPNKDDVVDAKHQH